VCAAVSFHCMTIMQDCSSVSARNDLVHSTANCTTSKMTLLSVPHLQAVQGPDAAVGPPDPMWAAVK
jgi:hypothetical protein